MMPMPMLRLRLKSLSGEDAAVEVDMGVTVSELAGLVERRVGWAARGGGGVRSLVHKGKVILLRYSSSGPRPPPPSTRPLPQLGVESGDVLICVLGNSSARVRRCVPVRGLPADVWADIASHLVASAEDEGEGLRSLGRLACTASQFGLHKTFGEVPDGIWTLAQEGARRRLCSLPAYVQAWVPRRGCESWAVLLHEAQQLLAPLRFRNDGRQPLQREQLLAMLQSPQTVGSPRPFSLEIDDRDRSEYREVFVERPKRRRGPNREPSAARGYTEQMLLPPGEDRWVLSGGRKGAMDRWCVDEGVGIRRRCGIVKLASGHQLRRIMFSEYTLLRGDKFNPTEDRDGATIFEAYSDMRTEPELHVDYSEADTVAMVRCRPLGGAVHSHRWVGEALCRGRTMRAGRHYAEFTMVANGTQQTVPGAYLVGANFPCPKFGLVKDQPNSPCWLYAPHYHWHQPRRNYTVQPHLNNRLFTGSDRYLEWDGYVARPNGWVQDGDVFGLLLDCDEGTLELYYNRVRQGVLVSPGQQSGVKPLAGPLRWAVRFL
jgi:hypothetical protein